jgi:hypothetical protein
MIKIGVGPVVSREEDLSSGKNLVDFMDSKGQFNVIQFFRVHKSIFPTLFIIVER